MPGKCRRKVGSRPYRNYTDDTLREAINEIKGKKLSIRKAAEKYGIHRNTLWLKLKEKHGDTPGHPTVFTKLEEDTFVSHCLLMSNYGFPLTGFDLRCIVKSYLDRLGTKVACFKNNFPGIEWQNSFLSRHLILTQRFAQNISTARAAVNEDVVNIFFDHLEAELDGVPSSNIWNYDETNLVDDPGSCKVITKRGTKYPEKIRNSTKACTSIMFCGNAEGRLAPVYINYKSKHLWNTWTEGGPEGARYNCTPSGWFDYNVFEDFFIHLMLPILKRQEGPKVLIGDNLSSHLNIDVIRQCEENNIRFIALPPNATHLLQPLDIAFFRPLKRNWKSILTDWKESTAGTRNITIPKQEFPGLLKKLVDKVEEDNGKNLCSGFRKCGIFPTNREVVLDRLCSRVSEHETESVLKNVSDSFIEHLVHKRAEVTEKRKIRKRRVNVTPGKSISVADLQSPSDNIPAPVPSGSKTRKKTSTHHTTESSEDSDVEVEYAESDASSWHEEVETMSDVEETPEVPPFVKEDKVVGNYVVVAYEGQHYPGKITEISKKGALINVMEAAGKHWRWPKEKDEIWYKDTEIIHKINAPRQRGRRGIFDVQEMKGDH